MKNPNFDADYLFRPTYYDGDFLGKETVKAWRCSDCIYGFDSENNCSNKYGLCGPGVIEGRTNE